MHSSSNIVAISFERDSRRFFASTTEQKNLAAALVVVLDVSCSCGGPDFRTVETGWEIGTKLNYTGYTSCLKIETALHCEELPVHWFTAGNQYTAKTVGRSAVDKALV